MLTVDSAERVAEAFDLGAAAQLVGPVAQGRVGRIWRLTTDRGRFAVKDSEHPVDPDEVARDAAYQEVVRAAGVPMPAVVRSRDGSELVDLDGSPVRAYTWVDVRGPERRLDPVAVGAVIARIHSVRVPAEGPVDPWSAAPLGADRWAELVDQLRSAGAPFAERLAALVPRVLEVESLLVTPEPVQLCHLDLWADNVLRSPSGDLVVLDWENSGPGVPVQEVACAMFEFCCGSTDRMRALASAYVESGGGDLPALPEDLTMLIAQMGHMAEVGCRRWLAATTDEARQDNADWVAEFVDEPVDAQVVEAILRAAAG